MRRTGLLILLLLAACPKREQADAPESREPAPEDRRVVDTHLHISPTEVGTAIEIMDEVGIAWGLNLSGHWPGGPLEEQLELAARAGRIAVACNLPWVLARRSDRFPEISAQILTEAKQLGARALKVEKALGLAARKPDGTLLTVDDPWLDPIWTRAAELGLPVVIHTGDPKAFWLPVDPQNERFEELSAHPGWSNYGDPEVPSFDQLLAQLIHVVERHPKTTFVSVHFGNNAEDPTWVGQMLDRYPNLNVDLAARLPEIGRHEAKRVREIFMRHADRILFGTDTGVSPRGALMLGSHGTSPNRREEVKPYFLAHWRWLETSDSPIPSPTPIQGRWPIHGIELPPGVLAKIYRENATRLFGPAPVRLTPLLPLPPAPK